MNLSDNVFIAGAVMQVRPGGRRKAENARLVVWLRMSGTKPQRLTGGWTLPGPVQWAQQVYEYEIGLPANIEYRS